MARSRRGSLRHAPRPALPDQPRLCPCREAKYLQQMDVAVPEAARLLLLQEDKFKFYFSQLSHVVREYEAVMAKVRCARNVGVSGGKAGGEAGAAGPRLAWCAPAIATVGSAALALRHGLAQPPWPTTFGAARASQHAPPIRAPPPPPRCRLCSSRCCGPTWRIWSARWRRACLSCPGRA